MMKVADIAGFSAIFVAGFLIGQDYGTEATKTPYDVWIAFALLAIGFYLAVVLS